LAESQLSNVDSLFYIINETDRQKAIINNSFLKLVDNYLDNRNFSHEISSTQEFGKSNVNNILLIYSCSLLKILNYDFYLKIMVQFMFYFREYLNISGWDFLKYLMKNNIITKIQDFIGEFCVKNDCIEIPHLINDFISTFINLIGLFHIKKEMIDVSRSFCHWLFINNLTYSKLLPNNFKG